MKKVALKKSGVRPPRLAKARAGGAVLVHRHSHEALELQNQDLLQSQLELESSRDHYADILDTAPVGFVTLTHSGIIREINFAGVRLLSSRHDHLIGWPFISFIAGRDKKVFLAHLSRCRENADPTRPMTVELQLARRAGQPPLFIELVSIPAKDKGSKQVVFKSVIRDVTELKQMLEAHRWLAAIVESSDDAIIGKDMDGIIISCNGGAQQLYGYPCHQLIGKPMTLLIPPSLQHEESEILRRLRSGEKIEHLETLRQCKDGRLIPVALTISPILNALGKIIGISNTARDISRRKEAEKKLEESLAREKAANRAKDDFLAALSHELRTPLNPVLLLASDGVRNADFPPQARMDFDTIRKNIELEARLIDDMLDLTRIMRGKLTLETKPVDIHAALHDAAGTVHADLAQKKINLISNLNAPRPTVLGDAVRLRQIFWNVLKNAVKFTPAGGTITVETRALPGDRMVITITDTGIGIEPDDIGRIFGAFTQGAHSFGGLGLGLAISRALAELHLGSISADSPGKGKGATFSVELPLAKESEISKDSTPSTPLPAEPVSGKGMRILLVEDHEPTRVSLTHLLVRRNFKVTPAGSLSEARALAEKEKINLLISDIGLPDGNGCDLMKELGKRMHLKGIALTGYGMEQDVNSTYAAGFTVHLTKPVRMESLDDALNQALAS